MRSRPTRWRPLLLLGVLLLLAHQQGGVDAAKKKKKRKKGKARKPPANGDQRCVACRRMLGHLESSLADEFNRMDRRVKGQAKSAAARGSDFDPTTARGMRLANLERMPAVDASLKSVCGATGLMRPELGTDCKRLLEDHIDDFESVLVNHEKYGGRPGMAKELCWKVASVCPEGADWDSKGFKRRAALTDADFRSEPIPRATEQPGIKGGIFKLVGKTVADAISEEGKDVFIHYRFPGTTFDDTYYKAWHDFGLLVHGTELEKTVLLAEIDVDANELPGGPPVGGEYVEAPCIVLYPAQVKHSPTYILLHTDPELSVKRQGPDFFWQWLNTHGQKETKWAVEELAQQRQLSGIQAPAVVDKKPAQALQKTKKKKKKPKHKREDAMVIPRQRVSTNSGVRPESYDRDSILTPELVCSACMVVIDEVEYSLRKLKDVGATVGRRLDAQGRGVSKRLNPGRNIVNVVEAMEHACDLTQEYGVSGTGKGQRWVRINAREQGEAILIESATVEAESPLKLTGSCSSFLEKYEDELEHALLHADPDTSIQDEFCMYYVEECNGATWDTTKRPSKLYPEGYDKVPDVVKEENFDDAIPIAGGSGGGAVTAGMLGPDRLPSRKQLAPPQKPLVDKDGYEIAQPPNSKAARNARTSMQRKSVSTKENLVGLGASTADAADAKAAPGAPEKPAGEGAATPPKDL